MTSATRCPRCQQPVSLPGWTTPELRVRCPLCKEEYLLGEALPPQLIVLDLPPSPQGFFASFPAEGPEGDYELLVEEPRGATGTHLSLKQEGSEKHSSRSATRDTSARARPRGSGRSFLRQMIGIVGGGILGLAIGYYVLLWLGGPPKDFLELGPRLPAWMLPAAFER